MDQARLASRQAEGSDERLSQQTSLHEVLCSHCDLPVPRARYREEQELQFCCSGCETVFHLLKSAGLDDYYAYRERLGEQGRRVDELETEENIQGSEFDSESFAQLYCTSSENGEQQTSLMLEGIHCAACVWLVERVGRLQPAVTEARVDFSQGRLDLRWDPEQAKLSEITHTLRKMGYQARPCRALSAERARRAELRALLLRMGVAGASAGNVMLMAFAMYSGAVGIEEAHTMDHQTRRFFEIASLVVSIPAFWAGGLFFRGAWASLRTRTPHMDLPIALGLSVGFVWGCYGALSGQGELYFDSLTSLVFFLLVGRYLQRRQQMVASEAAELVHAVLPATAICVREGERATVSRDSLLVGDVVWVKSGAVVPVDGVVTEGVSSLDKSLLSGESRPVAVQPGATAEAGSLNLGEPLMIEARVDGAATRVARLMTEVERALSTKTPLTGQADRLAGGFTLVVMLLAAVVGLFWLQESAASAVEHALSLLIVACPCALGLATPLALSAAVRKAAQAKMLVFAPEALEQLGVACEIVLDKTGTLTEGNLKVLSYEGPPELLKLVAQMEKEARHPVGRALLSYVGEQNNDNGPFDGLRVKETLGKGLSCEFEGKEYRLGSEDFIREICDGSWQFSGAPAGASPVFLSEGTQVLGCFWVGDAVRRDAAESLLALKRAGHRLHLLSGDHEKTAHDVAAELTQSAGIELFDSVRGGALPEEKLARINELKQGLASKRRPVVMVGDGINDSGALSAADVGVAVHGAAEASRLSAQVYLPLPGVAQFLELSQGSQRTLKVIRRGIVFSLLYNAVGISCAATGVLGPLGAAILMPLSSLSVVTNAYRSRTFLERKNDLKSV